ncbi:MAG TPA: hypothetical protein DGR97_12635 [Gammaproteobacteria bacterium]|nr:hypothetical protein [Gammaproteobacteria bacterium]
MSDDKRLHIVGEKIGDENLKEFDANDGGGDLTTRANAMADRMAARKRIWNDIGVEFDPDVSSLIWRNRMLLVKVYADAFLSLTEDLYPDTEFSRWSNKSEKYYRVTHMIISRTASNGFCSVREIQEWAAKGEYVPAGCDESEARLSISAGTVRGVFDYGEELGLLRKSETRKGYVFTRLGRSQLYDRILEKRHNKDLERLGAVINTIKAAEKMIRKTKELEENGTIVKVADSLVSLAWEGDI